MEAYPTSQPGSSARPAPPTAATRIIDANGKGRAAIQVDGACCREWGYPKAQRQQHKDQFKSQPQTGWQPITPPPSSAPSCRCNRAIRVHRCPRSGGGSQKGCSFEPTKSGWTKASWADYWLESFSPHISWSTVTSSPTLTVTWHQAKCHISKLCIRVGGGEDRAPLWGVWLKDVTVMQLILPPSPQCLP